VNAPESRAPGLKPIAILLVALSLSIGWGIRGNFGHNEGAMIPGALAGIAACLVSGREDWRRRAAYFGMFGAMGWWFGGSISYMQVVSYTHSGHAPSQLYGFAALWLIGFLWGAFGGAFTAMPAVATRKWLTDLFVPISIVLVLWTIWAYSEVSLVTAYREHVWMEDPNAFNKTEHRQENPFYWFDADWVLAMLALFGMWAYDLWDRRGNARGIPLFIVSLLVGMFVGFYAQWGLIKAGLLEPLLNIVVVPQGDLTKYSADQLLTNWPQFLSDIHHMTGTIFGMLIAASIYFAVFGRFRSGSSLIAHMAGGWLLMFIAGPVLLSIVFRDFGGFRLTPPRGDDWAGMLGAFLGLVVYALRNRLLPVAYAGIVSGVVGGLGFAGMVCLKLILVSPGNHHRLNPEQIDPSPTAELELAWAHWQSANWHSVLEQTYGFVNGIGIAIALGLLATRVPRIVPVETASRFRAWTQVYAVSFVLFFVMYLNLYKNVAVWTKEMVKPVPSIMKAPLFESLEFSTYFWFNLTFALIAGASIVLMFAHLRRPISVVPASPMGKGQLFYLLLLWMIVIGNFERALAGFNEQRLITEWVIFVNAVIVTMMILLQPRDEDTLEVAESARFAPLLYRAIAVGTVASSLLVLSYFGIVRGIYGGAFAGHAGYQGKPQHRFGDNAEWRIRPNLRKGEHS